MSDAAAPRPSAWDPEQKPSSGPDATVERGFLSDLLHFAWENKIWWIAPTVIILLGLGAMVWFAQGQLIAPFFYALF